jgi:hypothetical protein
MSREQAGGLTLSPALAHDRPSRRGAHLRLHLDDCRFTRASPFRALVRETALRVDLEPRALGVRVLLHLPRVASHSGWVTRWQVQRELRINAAGLHTDESAVRSDLAGEGYPLSELAFDEIDPNRGVRVLTALHYLRSSRPGSRYFALVNPVGRPVSLCSISPLQWQCVARAIHNHFGISPERVLDVSRVYSLSNAPRNAISTLLSKLRTYVRQSLPSIDLLVTAIDPNLGFTGSSYRAANWQEWMTVKARPYLYDNDRYVSPRELRERYGTGSLTELQAKYPDRFEQSVARLLDSSIYCCRINGETRVVSAQDRPRLRR